MFEDIDPITHSQVRLSIMSVLIGVKNAEFNYLLDNIKTTKGNLSFQINKLNEAGYFEVKNSYKVNYPLTTCVITELGIKAYEIYINSIDESPTNQGTQKEMNKAWVIHLWHCNTE